MNKDIVAKDYLPWVKYIARDVYKKNRVATFLTVDDLVSCGVIGLLEAIERFDKTRDVKFKSFAELRVRGAMLDEIRDLSTNTRRVNDKLRFIGNASRELELKLGKNPTALQISKEIKIPLDEFYRELEFTSPVTLLTKDDFTKDDKKSLTSWINKKYNQEEHLIKRDMKRLIKKHVAALPLMQRKIMRLHLKGLSNREISKLTKTHDTTIGHEKNKAIRDIKNLIQQGVYL
jgi:RNA polymerase sigma factor for flagellar operon FliA